MCRVRYEAGEGMCRERYEAGEGMCGERCEAGEGMCRERYEGMCCDMAWDGMVVRCAVLYCDM